MSENTNPAPEAPTPELSELEKLKAQLTAQQAIRKTEIANTIEVRKLELEISKVSSPIFLEREVTRQNSLRLTAIISAFEDLSTGAATDKPVKPVFGYGSQVDKILTIVRSVLFAKKEHRDTMEAMVGLDPDLIEDTIDSLGSPAYYSLKENAIIPAVQPDIPSLSNNLKLVAMDLGITSLRLHKVTTANITGMYERADAKAKELMENTLNYQNENTDTKYAV